MIPIIVRDVNWYNSPFAQLQALPKDGRAISLWKYKDSAWRNVSDGIEKIISQRLKSNDVLEVQPLLISKVRLKNISCFEELEISFATKTGLNKFVMFFGDNGTGKSTLLRSIAIGLCDQTVATSLSGMLPGKLLRDKEDEGLIDIEFSNFSFTKRWSVKTMLSRGNKGMVNLRQDFPKDFPRNRIFSCGYGAGRRGFGSQDYSGYSLKHSLVTLFNYDKSLQNPELAFRRIESQGIRINELTQLIDSILMLEPGSTHIDSTGIHVDGTWGDFMPIGALGDGFQATLGWIADLFGWALFHEAESLKTGIAGIVFIDEIEQHLHPSWQREIISLLHKQFPLIQFIVTSHSPMCALGATALPETITEVIRLKRVDGHIEINQHSVPKKQRADQVLTSSLFGLYSASGFDVYSDIQRYAFLSSKKENTLADQSELIMLKESLQETLGPFHNEMEKRIYDTVQKVMQEELITALKRSDDSKSSLDLQIKHRLKQLFNPPEGAE